MGWARYGISRLCTGPCFRPEPLLSVIFHGLPTGLSVREDLALLSVYRHLSEVLPHVRNRCWSSESSLQGHRSVDPVGTRVTGQTRAPGQGGGLLRNGEASRRRSSTGPTTAGTQGTEDLRRGQDGAGPPSNRGPEQQEHDAGAHGQTEGQPVVRSVVEVQRVLLEAYRLASTDRFADAELLLREGVSRSGWMG